MITNSLEIREFKQAISNFIVENKLPDEVKRMVLSEILNEQENRTLNTLKAEISERNRKEKKEYDGGTENGNEQDIQLD